MNNRDTIKHDHQACGDSVSPQAGAYVRKLSEIWRITRLRLKVGVIELYSQSVSVTGHVLLFDKYAD